MTTTPGTTSEAPITACLQRWNLPETPIRPVIERIWAAIHEQDDWTPLRQWLAQTVLLETSAVG